MNLIKDLIEYTGKSEEEVITLCNTAEKELVKDWNTKHPVTEEDIKDYYITTKWYLYDLTRYQLMIDQGSKQAITQLIREGVSKILDFGGGIGHQTALMLSQELDVTYLELADSHTLKYAEWRFKKYNFKPEIITTLPEELSQFDCIFAMDVLEHIPHHEELIKKFARSCKYIVANPFHVNFNESVPQHISAYDLTEYYDQIGEYVWRGKLI